jgi:hypothetical protein
LAPGLALSLGRHPDPTAMASGFRLGPDILWEKLTIFCSNEKLDEPGSLFRSLFLAILTNFRRKKIGVFPENQCYDQFLPNKQYFESSLPIFNPFLLAKIFSKS